MHVMQYEITLPSDYDMGIVRQRVATRGHLLDGFPGLGLKAYLLRERGDTSPVNQYAPLYLWSAPEGMNAFLWGPGFQGIVDDFGRPGVRHWTGLLFQEGAASEALPRTAVRRRELIADTVAPAVAVEAALEESRRRAATPGAVATALAVDPRHWELLHFTLWEDEPSGDPGDRYEVLHLSSPERDRLRRGKQW
ncbi:DUF4865 family protein [Streptomyces sp. QL37]|uniref:DUF4865 family protein n=1 Tax=Streptomyces sp. QL37 TaxID=2093747 RepID=UPI000CF2BE3B|nr:DUF4865 family protein [Streptomyces sp. QL37]PPQ62670.1 DUF4865 domain-containing protein [Streptomyces sp. QL37]